MACALRLRKREADLYPTSQVGLLSELRLPQVRPYSWRSEILPTRLSSHGWIDSLITEGRYTPISNSFNTQPLWFDTDTTTGAGTNWRGANGGSQFVGKIGIKPLRIDIIQATSGTAIIAGNITITDPQWSGGGQGLFSYTLRAAAGGTQDVPIQFDLLNSSALWRDFIITGLTATKAALQIYYSV